MCSYLFRVLIEEQAATGLKTEVPSARCYGGGTAWPGAAPEGCGGLRGSGTGQAGAETPVAEGWGPGGASGLPPWSGLGPVRPPGGGRRSAAGPGPEGSGPGPGAGPGGGTGQEAGAEPRAAAAGSGRHRAPTACSQGVPALLLVLIDGIATARNPERERRSILLAGLHRFVREELL